MTFPLPTASTLMVVQSILLVSLTGSMTEVEVMWIIGAMSNGEGIDFTGDG
jgi:hypothetical protein